MNKEDIEEFIDRVKDIARKVKDIIIRGARIIKRAWELYVLGLVHKDDKKLIKMINRRNRAKTKRLKKKYNKKLLEYLILIRS